MILGKMLETFGEENFHNINKVIIMNFRREEIAIIMAGLASNPEFINSLKNSVTGFVSTHRIAEAINDISSEIEELCDEVVNTKPTG